LPERGEGKNFTGHVPLRYLKVMKLDNRGEGAEFYCPIKRIFSDFPHQKVLFLLICWPGDISAVNLDMDNELKEDRKVKVLKSIQNLGYLNLKKTEK